MAQNITEGIIQLGLVVTGLENLKSMTDHQRRFREETERIKPAEAKTILTIEDLTQPILKANIRSWEQLAAIVAKVGLNAAAAIPQLERLARAAGFRATSANIGAQAAQFGLYPGDVAAIDEGQRLSSAARRAYRGLERSVRRPTSRLNRGGYIGYFGDSEIQKAVNYLGRNGPAMGYPQLAALTSEDTVLDEAEAANLIATIAPQIEAANVVTVMRTGLRAAMASGPFLGMNRRAFGKGTISPAAGQLAAIGPLGAFAEGNFGAKVTERLNRLALALAQMPKGFAFTGEPEPVRMSRLSRALLNTSEFFGLPPGATAPYVRDEYTEQAEALEREAARRNIPARYTPRQVRPRYFGTGIEVTGRFVRAETEDPLGERAAALARLQGEGLIPPFAVPGQRSGLMGRVRNYLGGWLPSWLPMGESGMARVGRGSGSITQDAIDYISELKGKNPVVYPGKLGRVLNLPPENISLLINSLQRQGYIEKEALPGNFGGYPVVPPSIRRQRQFQEEMAAKALKDQTTATQEETTAAKAKANAAKKAAAATNQEAESEEALAAANADALRRRKGFIFRGQTFLGPGAVPPGGVPVFAGQRFATEAPNFFGASEELGPTSIGPGAWFGGGGGGFGGGGVTNMFGVPLGGGGGGGGGGRAGLFSFGRFASRFGGLANFVGAAAIIYPVASLIFGAVGASVELEANVKRIQAIYGNHTLGAQLTIQREIVQAARDLGENVNEVAQAAQQFAQEQFSFADMGKNLEAAAIGAKAFGTNIKEVADYIIAVNRTTGGKVGGLEAVNLVAAISRRAAVPPEAVMQTIQNVLPDLGVFAQPGGNISNPALLASLTGIESRYGRVTGQQTGAALRFLISRLGNPKAVANIEALSGVQLGTAASGGTELKSFDQILNEISQSYERLIKTGHTGEAQQLMRELFGARQATAGTIILTHFKDALDLVTGSLNDQEAASRMAAEQLDTTKSSVERLRTAMTDLMTNLIPIGHALASAFTPVVDALSALAKTISNIPHIQPNEILGMTLGGTVGFLLAGPGGAIGGAILGGKVGSELPSGKFPVTNIDPTLARASRLGFLLSPQSVLAGTSPTGQPLPTQSLMFVGQNGPFGRDQYFVPPSGGLFNKEFPGGTTGIGAVVSSPTNEKGKNLVMPGSFLEAFQQFERSITGSSTLLQQLGIDADNAHTKLQKIKDLLRRFYSPEEGAGKGPQGAILLRQFNETVAEINKEDLDRNAITIERARHLQDLRFTTAVGRIARRGVEETPEATLQERVNDVLDTQRIKREEILFSYRDQRDLLIQQAKDDKERLPFLDAELEKVDRKYELELRGLNLEERQLIMEQQSNFLVEQKTHKLQEQRAVQNELNKITQQGLQGIIKGIEQERSTGGRVRLGQLFTSQLLGPLASNITGKIGANFDLFGEKGLFPGVGRFIDSTLGRKQYPVPPPTIEDATREVQAERATQGVMSRGGGVPLAQVAAQRLAEDTAKWKAAKDAFDKKQARDQLIVSAGTFAGQLVGASEGGSEAAVNIGSSIGALAGTAIAGPAGGAIGGLLGGAIGGLFGHHRRSPEVGHLQIIAENTREQVRLLENTNKLLETNFVSFNVPTGFRLPAYVPGSFGGVGGLRGASGGVVNSQIAVNVNIGGTNVGADKLGQTIAQAISDRLELESRSSGGYFPRMLYG